MEVIIIMIKNSWTPKPLFLTSLQAAQCYEQWKTGGLLQAVIFYGVIIPAVRVSRVNQSSPIFFVFLKLLGKLYQNDRLLSCFLQRNFLFAKY